MADFTTLELEAICRAAEAWLRGSDNTEIPLPQRKLTDPLAARLIFEAIDQWARLKAWENGLETVPEEGK